MDPGPPPKPPTPPPTPPPPPQANLEPTSYTQRIQAQIAQIVDLMDLPQRLLDVAVRLLHQYYHLEIGKTGRGPGCGERITPTGLTATSAALVLIASRQEKVPRDFRTISKATGIQTKYIFHRFDRIQSLIQESGARRLERPQPAMYLPRFCGNLGLGFDVEKKARQILAQSNESASAVALAAAAVSAVHHNESSLNQLVQMSGVSKPTIKRLVKKIQI